jgi:hypothetical protein
MSTTPKAKTGNALSSKHTSFDFNFEEGAPVPSSATKSFMKRFSFTGAK